MKMSSIILFIILNIAHVNADEGMWLLPHLKEINAEAMKKAGLKISPAQIFSNNKRSIKDGVVKFANRCTGEIISENGLLLTNHHCGYEFIQSLSSIDNNILKNGFWAKSFADELPNKNISVSFLIKTKDVTDKIIPELHDTLDETTRLDIINEIKKTIIAEEIKGTHYTADIEEVFSNNRYYLYVYETFEDVRLVGTPPESIGKFGGDTDNWMWPRHTGDISLFRVYMSPSGKPAPYAKENIPYKPKHYFPISIKAKKEGDFSMILGYPGSTKRHITSYETKSFIELINPNRIEIRSEKLSIMRKSMMANDTIKIQYADKYSSSSNYWKYSIGQNKYLQAYQITAKKKNEEKSYINWAQTLGSEGKQYIESLDKIKDYISRRADFLNAHQSLRECFLLTTEGIMAATNMKSILDIVGDTAIDIAESNLVEQKKKNIEDMTTFWKNYNKELDKKLTVSMLELYKKKIPKTHQPSIYQYIDSLYKGDINKFTDKLFATSIFVDKSKYEALMNDSVIDTLAIVNDLAYKTGMSFFNTYDELTDSLIELKKDYDKYSRIHIKGLMLKEKGKALYPDANFTMRFTYGNIKGYSTVDGIYNSPFTTLDGLIAKKDTANFEFEIDTLLESFYEQKNFGRYASNNRLPVNFLSTNDITGGNSGSPVLNEKGELIGCTFDGNWESMSGDILYLPEIQRAISVDSRYILFLIEQLGKADYLLNEIKIIQ